MKLTVRNLGRIEQAEFDIRPLTVFVGENGTNKTWVAYSLYGIMRGFVAPGSLHSADLEVEHKGPVVEDSEVFRRLVADNARLAITLAQAAGAAFSLKRDLIQYFPQGEVKFEEVGRAPFLRQLLRLADVSSAVEVGLRFDRLEFHSVMGPVRIQASDSGAWVDIHVPERQHRVVVDSPDKLRSTDFWIEVLALASSLWASPHVGVFVLPAERKALASAYDLLRDEFADTVSVPVADYAEFLRRHRNLLAHGVAPDASTPFGDLVNLLETQIVKGAIGFVTGPDGSRFSFKPSQQVELPIHAASSLVRALAGLDLYLQTTARPGDFLFIDEVEMNAHPEAQLALVELLAILVNRGIHIVMTTHSPYIVEHLNNLMAAAQAPSDRQDELIPLFQLKSREAFLAPDKVAAYGFTPQGEKVKVEDVLDRETGTIDWRTFSRVTDELSEIYGRILESRERT